MITRFTTAVFFFAVLATVALAQDTMLDGGIREGTFGDRITGDIHRGGEGDVFVGHAVKGSKFKMSLGPVGRGSNYRALGPITGNSAQEYYAVVGGTSLLDVVRPPGLLPVKKGKGVRFLTTELDVTGEYRIVVLTAVSENGNPYAGDYQLKSKVKPPRRFRLSEPFPVGGGDAEAVFGALPGSTATISVRAGRGTELPELVDLVAPSADDPREPGESIFVGLEPKIGKKSVSLKGVPLPAFGDYRIRLRSETGGVWKVTVKVKPPRIPGEKLDVRQGTPPDRWPVMLEIIGTEPRVDPRDPENPNSDERFAGGATLFYFTPGTSRPSGIILAPCKSPDVKGVGTDNPPSGFDFLCLDSESFVGEAREVTWEKLGNSFYTKTFLLTVQTPEGPGASVFTDVLRDDPSSFRPTGWKEVRTYGEEGLNGPWTFRVRDIVRKGNTTISFWVDAEGPDGPLGSFPVPAWILEKPE
jgi:hypothetical protein